MTEAIRISTGSPFEKTFGFSRAIVKGGWCFVAGVTGYDYTTMEMPVGIANQARNCFATINSVLTEAGFRSEEHTSELQSRRNPVCRLPLEKKKHT